MKGFTLIELLVVIMIVALGAALVSLNVGNVGAVQRLALAATEFAGHTRSLALEAVITGESWGVQLYRDPEQQQERLSYRWLQLNQGRWVAAAPEQIEAVYALPANLSLELEVEGVRRPIKSRVLESAERSSEEEIPDILLLGSGEVTPFELSFIDEEQGLTTRVTGDLLGRIKLDRELGDDD